MINTIAIVGRPNVGKSSLLNALVNRRTALTSPNPGLTRDRSYAHFSPGDNLSYILIDTGGLIFGSDKAIDEKVNIQVDVAIGQADLLLFVTDASTGVTPMDELVADKLRIAAKPAILVVNKADSPEKDILENDFWKLGFRELISVSALHRRNMAGLIDRITAALPDSMEKEERGEFTVLSVAGKPNAGKSTLVNRIAGGERVIVDEIPGTTRNPARCFVDIRGREWELVDLAGMWRKKRSKEIEEVISMLASRREIGNSDICIFIIDLTQPLTFQDKRIAGWIIEGGTSVVVAGNKADLVDLTPRNKEVYRKELISQIPYLDFAPFVMISAQTGFGIERLYDELEKVRKSAQIRIPQEELDALLVKLISKRPPPEVAARRPEAAGLYQEKVNPPVFRLALRHHRLDKLPEHWKNYVRNFIMKEYRFYGAPVTIKIARAGRKRNR